MRKADLLDFAGQERCQNFICSGLTCPPGTRAAPLEKMRGDGRYIEARRGGEGFALPTNRAAKGWGCDGAGLSKASQSGVGLVGVSHVRRASSSARGSPTDGSRPPGPLLRSASSHLRRSSMSYSGRPLQSQRLEMRASQRGEKEGSGGGQREQWRRAVGAVAEGGESSEK